MLASAGGGAAIYGIWSVQPDASSGLFYNWSRRQRPPFCAMALPSRKTQGKSVCWERQEMRQAAMKPNKGGIFLLERAFAARNSSRNSSSNKRAGPPPFCASEQKRSPPSLCAGSRRKSSSNKKAAKRVRARRVLLPISIFGHKKFERLAPGPLHALPLASVCPSAQPSATPPLQNAAAHTTRTHFSTANFAEPAFFFFGVRLLVSTKKLGWNKRVLWLAASKHNFTHQQLHALPIHASSCQIFCCSPSHLKRARQPPPTTTAAFHSTTHQAFLLLPPSFQAYFSAFTATFKPTASNTSHTHHQHTDHASRRRFHHHCPQQEGCCLPRRRRPQGLARQEGCRRACWQDHQDQGQAHQEGPQGPQARPLRVHVLLAGQARRGPGKEPQCQLWQHWQDARRHVEGYVRGR